MNNKYIIGPSFINNSNFAGTKYPADVMYICEKAGCAIIKIQESYNGRNFYRFLLDILSILINIKRGDYIFYIDRVAVSLSRHMVYKIAKFKNCKIIPILEDIDVLRNPGNNDNHEIDLLKQAYMIISQNDAMSNFLLGKGVRCEIISTSVLDFLSNTALVSSSAKSNIITICYGGNLALEQSGFIYELKPSKKLRYKIYGGNLKRSINNPSISYCGFFSADDCVHNIIGDWGLVWNGRSLKIDNVDSKSTYYNYVTPHKFSMYALCGLPVIVYEKSAMADFVIKNKCGIIVNNLNEIEEKITKVSNNQYYEMKQNILKIGERASDGYYLKKAISYIYEKEKNIKCLD